jgi:hypothetical protein
MASKAGSSRSVVMRAPKAEASSLRRLETLHRTRQARSDASVAEISSSFNRRSRCRARERSPASLPSVTLAIPPLTRRARATQLSTDSRRTESCSSRLSDSSSGSMEVTARAPASCEAAVTVMARGTGGGTAAALMSPVSTLSPSVLLPLPPAPAPATTPVSSTILLSVAYDPDPPRPALEGSCGPSAPAPAGGSASGSLPPATAEAMSANTPQAARRTIGVSSRASRSNSASTFSRHASPGAGAPSSSMRSLPSEARPAAPPEAAAAPPARADRGGRRANRRGSSPQAAAREVNQSRRANLSASGHMWSRTASAGRLSQTEHMAATACRRDGQRVGR